MSFLNDILSFDHRDVKILSATRRRTTVVRKLKFSVALPLIQLGIAALLLTPAMRDTGGRGLDTPYADTAVIIYHGLNAPALLFRALRFIIPRELTFSLYGFGPDEFLLLAGVIVLWFAVGRALESYGSSGTRHSQTHTARALSILLYVSLTLWGASLAYMGVNSILHPGRWNNALGNITEGILFLLWSIVLISASSLRLMALLRGGAGKPISR